MVNKIRSLRSFILICVFLLASSAAFADYASPDESEMGEIEVKLYKEADAKSAFTKVILNESVDISKTLTLGDDSGEWHKVEMDGKIGWLSGKDICVFYDDLGEKEEKERNEKIKKIYLSLAKNMKEFVQNKQGKDWKRLPDIKVDDFYGADGKPADAKMATWTSDDAIFQALLSKKKNYIVHSAAKTAEAYEKLWGIGLYGMTAKEFTKLLGKPYGFIYGETYLYYCEYSADGIASIYLHMKDGKVANAGYYDTLGNGIMFPGEVSDVREAWLNK